MTRRPVRLIVLAAAAVLAGCGSSPSHATPTATHPEASRTAHQIYDDSLTAMTRERSVHIVGHQVDSTGAAADIDIVDTARSARVILRDSSGTAYLVVTPDAVEVSPTPDGPYGAAPADVTIEASSLPLQPTVRCARIEHGALTKGPTSTVDGTRVIAIEDDGSAPGASPSTDYVAVSGPPLLVREVVHGATTPGGRVDCGHAPDDTSPPTVSATYDFRDWGRAVTITPPPTVPSGPTV
jgi:hypothetical protein